jgi:hypothetical protein
MWCSNGPREIVPAVGSSSWHYCVDYRPDVAAALEQLRYEVYQYGTFYREPRDADLDLTEEEFRAQLGPADPHDDGMQEAILADWRNRRRVPPPTGPDSLCRAQPHSGTHSVIDMINGVSPVPAFAAVSALTDEELLSAFGTTTPDSAAVRDWAEANKGLRPSWFGTYIVGYRDGVPERLHFFGFSGD